VAKRQQEKGGEKRRAPKITRRRGGGEKEGHRKKTTSYLTTPHKKKVTRLLGKKKEKRRGKGCKKPWRRRRTMKWFPHAQEKMRTLWACNSRPEGEKGSQVKNGDRSRKGKMDVSLSKLQPWNPQG